MRYNKDQKKLVDYLGKHGLTVERGSKHYLIKKNGKTISSFSSTMSDINGMRSVIRCLVHDNVLPPTAKREMFP